MFPALPSVLFQKAVELTAMPSRRPQTLTTGRLIVNSVLAQNHAWL